MPFPKQQRYEFTASVISTMSANQPGVYGIFNHSVCIYIGQADDIRESLLGHASGRSDLSACIFQKDPQYWLAAILSRTQLSFWEKILWGEYKPVCRHLR